MPHHSPLITTIVAGIGLAFLFGAIAARLRVPPLVGYLLAGIVVGPFTPGYVADQALTPQLAEIGVILLMFGVGLHFSLKDLLSVAAIAVPGAVAQIAVATGMGVALALALGWSLPAGLVFGLALSVASTVVLLRAMQERRLVDTERGRIAVGWLVVEDLAMVLALVLLPAFAAVVNGDGSAAPRDWISDYFDLDWRGMLALTFAKVAAFVALMLVVGRKVIPWILHVVAHMGSRELFRLAVLAIALGVAYAAAELFGVSLALGAFFAGMMLKESELSHQAAQETLPLRDAFAVLFFVSAGMLFDPSVLWRDPLTSAAVLGIILFGKSLAAFLIVRAFGHPNRTALTISASLAQIGEFSFILAEVGVRLHLLPDEARALILAGAILSILVNPLMFAVLDRLERRDRKPDADAPGTDDDGAAKRLTGPETPAPRPATALENHVVLVGCGRVGSMVGEELRRRGEPFLVIDEGDAILNRLRELGVETLPGNAAAAETLAAARLDRARCLVTAIPNAFETSQVVEAARRANPAIRIVARVHSEEHARQLQALGADDIVMGEREIARGVVERLFAPVADRSDGRDDRLT